MLKSSLSGRRIHIAGCVSEDVSLAPADRVKQARTLVNTLSQELIARGATFVVPVDRERRRALDRLPICFDWLVINAVATHLARRPTCAPNPLIIAVQHHKTEEQVPSHLHSLWDGLRNSDLVQIENVSHWNMNAKRMEAQARWGDILIAVGGSEGVLFLANLYHDAGKPVVPLNMAVSGSDTGARRLFALGLSDTRERALFRTVEHSTHTWMNRINLAERKPVEDRVTAIVNLLEALELPVAFVVRLLDPSHGDYADVQAYHDTVVQPIVEGELGYRMVVVDGRHPYDESRIDQEVFSKLHRSSIVLSDITGMRPNCFLELGYALGRGLPTILMAREGTPHPFDISTFAGLHWKAKDPAEDRRRAFREHWEAVRNRPPLVSTEPLVA